MLEFLLDEEQDSTCMTRSSGCHYMLYMYFSLPSSFLKSCPDFHDSTYIDMVGISLKGSKLVSLVGNSHHNQQIHEDDSLEVSSQEFHQTEIKLKMPSFSKLEIPIALSIWLIPPKSICIFLWLFGWKASQNNGKSQVWRMYICCKHWGKGFVVARGPFNSPYGSRSSYATPIVQGRGLKPGSIVNLTSL